MDSGITSMNMSFEVISLVSIPTFSSLLSDEGMTIFLSHGSVRVESWT